jgi:hypothetical protein
MTQRLLEYAGIGKERLHLEWLSSAEAQRFTEIAVKVTDAVREAGKLDREALKMQIDAAEMTVDSETVRWLVGKEVSITRKGDVYGRSWGVEKYESVLDEALEREYDSSLIILAIKEGFTSIRDIGQKTGLDTLRVSYLLADLERTGRAEFRGMTDSIPEFSVL